MNDDDRKLTEEAGAAAYGIAVELRKLANQKSIRPAQLMPAIDQLAIVMRNLESLTAARPTVRRCPHGMEYGAVCPECSFGAPKGGA